MTMKRRRSLLLAALALSGALAVAGVAAADTTAPTGDVAAFPTVFVDASGTETLAIQLQPGHADTGQFNFFVAGRGDYTGVIPVDTTGNHDHVQGEVTAQFLPDADSGATASSDVKMEGIVAPATLDANVNVWVDGTHYHLQTNKGNAGDAQKVAAQAIAALKAEDWGTLYGLLASAMRADYTQADFVQTMTSQSAQGPTPVSIATSGPGQVSTSSYGYTYYQQPLTVQGRAADGSTKTLTTTLYLLREQGSWHFWLTDDPSASEPGT